VSEAFCSECGVPTLAFEAMSIMHPGPRLARRRIRNP